jgi:hypothetical protein
LTTNSLKKHDVLVDIRPSKQAVTAALEEYIQHRKQQRILEAFGTVDFDPEYDYKAERRRKRMG